MEQSWCLKKKYGDAEWWQTKEEQDVLQNIDVHIKQLYICQKSLNQIIVR